MGLHLIRACDPGLGPPGMHRHTHHALKLPLLHKARQAFPDWGLSLLSSKERHSRSSMLPVERDFRRCRVLTKDPLT